MAVTDGFELIYENFTCEETAEVMRKKHHYRRLILTGKMVLPRSKAAQLLGPDCLYHLYGVAGQAEATGAKRRSSPRGPLQIRMLSCLPGARRADGRVVIIDVFRASNTLIALLAAGARTVVPVATLAKARALREQGCVVAGERQGLKPKDFDLGNSPAAASRLNLQGKVVVFTTSAGTKGLLAPRDPEEVLVGSFANAQALSRYLRKSGAGRISLVAMGLRGRERAQEDEQCALYIRALVEGRKPDFGPIRDSLLRCRGAQRLRRLKQIDDLEYCLQPNRSRIIPVLRSSNGRNIIVPLAITGGHWGAAAGRPGRGQS